MAVTDEACATKTAQQHSKHIWHINFAVSSPTGAVKFSNALLFGFGIVEQCTKLDKILNLLKSETTEAGIDGANLSLLSYLMKLQLSGINEPQQTLSPLLYPTYKFDIHKPLLHFVQDSALSSKITVHPDGQITFMGTAIELKDLFSVVAESYLSKCSPKGGKQSMLEEFESIFTQEKSEAASCDGGSESSPLDPVQEEKLRNQSWIVATGGITNKGRLYGVGKVSSMLRLEETFTNPSFSHGNNQDSEKILQLQEEVRQSREQNERLQRKFESLLNAVLPLMPADAQTFLQQQTDEPPAD
ncbi:hypothetical protein Fmac_005832 [Flemingia macrophylla]|uniref:Uncharacterized protein n=1 Tax=Flemingia macrophylla TaxID=520843 RepID=A0ABD1N8V9_9FABA